MSKKPANNNLPSLQELQQLQRNLPKLPDSMDPQKKRLIYGLLAVFAVIVLIIGLVYVSKNGVDGLLGSDTTTSATDEETTVATETLAEVKNPYKAVDPDRARTGSGNRKERAGVPAGEGSRLEGWLLSRPVRSRLG